MNNDTDFRQDGRRHHHVPRLLLNRFATKRKKRKFQTHVFDKESGKSFLAAVENIMLEMDFNAIERDGTRLSFERGMGSIEAQTAPILEKILSDQNLKNISVNDRANLCLFLALQFLRGPSKRNLYLDISENLQAKLVEMIGKDNLPEEYAVLPDEEEVKISALRTIHESLGEFAAHFANKDMLLAKAPKGHPFILGDSPVTMMNDRDHGFYGNIGLAVLGIQIYMPINPEYTLGFWCPSVLKEFEESVVKTSNLVKRAKAQALISRPEIAKEILTELNSVIDADKPIARLVQNIRTGLPLECTPENVCRYNSLQVHFAQRWLVSKTDSFDLAREMIADNPKYKFRPKPKIG